MRDLAGDRAQYIEMKRVEMRQDGEDAKRLAWKALVDQALVEDPASRRRVAGRWEAGGGGKWQVAAEPVDEARCLRTAQGALLPIEEAKALLHRVYGDNDIRTGAPAPPNCLLRQPALLATPHHTLTRPPTSSLSRTPTPVPLPERRGRRENGPGLHGERPPLH